MIEPISPAWSVQPVQSVQPIQQLQPIQRLYPVKSIGAQQRIQPTRVNLTPQTATSNNVTPAINQGSKPNTGLENNANNSSIINSGGKFIQGNESRLEHLKSIYGEKALKKIGVMECATCKERTYVDVSDDPSVSFQTPTNISPGQSFSAVAGHEAEHVSNEQSKAAREGAQVVSQSVVLQSGVCPECGAIYTAGGKTTTVTKTPAQPSVNVGELVDMKV